MEKNKKKYYYQPRQKNKRKRSAYIRRGSFSVQDILPHVITQKEKKQFRQEQGDAKGSAFRKFAYRTFNGKSVYMADPRLEVFLKHGVECVRCGVKGVFFVLEKGRGRFCHWHFNLYGHNLAGHEVMLTRDHILPKSRGGSDNLDNMQTMCSNCNAKKRDFLESDYDETSDTYSATTTEEKHKS